MVKGQTREEKTAGKEARSALLVNSERRQEDSQFKICIHGYRSSLSTPSNLPFISSFTLPQGQATSTVMVKLPI